MDKRKFLAAGLGLGFGTSAALAQGSTATGVDELGRGPQVREARPAIPVRKAKTTKLFLTPPGWPNAIAVDPTNGFWVQEQRHDGNREKAWLLDWNGKLLNTVTTNCKNTSGMTFGDGCIWSGANGASIKNHPNPPVNGIFQTNTSSREVSHRQIPFGPVDDGGPCQFQPAGGLGAD
jgi:hypothetical protein